MLTKRFLYLLVMLVGVHFNVFSQKETIKKKDFYKNLASDKLNTIDEQLNSIDDIPENEAYIGYLEMRKSDFIKNLGEKLSLFKSGRKKLEQSIKKESNNIEFRFLRLIIQEHAPQIVNYYSDIDEDVSFIKQNYKKMNAVIQDAILDYEKHSKHLKL